MVIKLRDRDSFEPLPGESKIWFDRYILFRDLEYAPIYETRTVHLVATIVRFQRNKTICSSRIPIDEIREHIKEHGKSDPSGSMIIRCQHFRWKERCQIYDVIKHRELQEERLVKEREIRDRFANFTNKMLDRAMDIIAIPLVEKRKLKDGQTTVFKPIGVRASDAAIYLKEARELAKFGYNISENKISELEAIQVLVEAGYLPPEVINATAEGLSELKAKILSSFRQVENETQSADQGDESISDGDNESGSGDNQDSLAAEEE